MWTFYEATKPSDIDFYQNPKYVENFEYPDEWIEESGRIDDWISVYEDWLYDWERELLVKIQGRNPGIT